MITTIFSKPLYNGGRNFLIYNDITKKYHIGNTASTAVSYHNYDVSVDDVTTKQIRFIAKRLNFLGYSEHKVKWRTDQDPYEQIIDNLLAKWQIF